MTIVENTPDRLILEHVAWGALASSLGFISLFIGVSILFIVADIPFGAVIFMIVGAGVPILAIVLTTARSQLVFDRTRGEVDHRRRSFRGTTRHPFPLAAVTRVYVGKNGPTKGRLFLEVNDTMDEGHHAFPKYPAKIDGIVAAHCAADAWLTQ